MYSCKMCGVALDAKAFDTLEKCPYCGMMNDVVRIKDVFQENQLDKANYYRRNRDYVRAAGLYNGLIRKDEELAVAHWGKLLCEYGVEYISDLASGTCVPVCNNMKEEAVFENPSYKAAIRFAGEELQSYYEQEAKKIQLIQQEMAKETEQENPYDVFLCYRESDSEGNPTKDSELAQELYEYLGKNGFDVFYERECKKQHGDTIAYRAHAARTATVMLVVGTSAESFDSPLVKMEWNERLKTSVEGDADFLVAYKDMDMYELPDEIMHLQAKNMNRLSFLQELLEELERLCDRTDEAEETEEQEQGMQGAVSAESLTERAFLCLEDGEFTKADELLEQALNCKAKYAKAYIGKLMVRLGACVEEDLAKGRMELTGYKEYNRIMRFGDAEQKKQIEDYNNQIIERKQTEELSAKQARYEQAMQQLEAAQSEQEYLAAARIFNEVGAYKDAEEKYSSCMQTAAKENSYQNAMRLLHNNSFDEAESVFLQIEDYKDAADMADNCRKEKVFQNGLQLLGNRKYEEAAEVFQGLGDYKNAAEQVVRCQKRVDRETLEKQKNEKKEELQAQKEQIKKEIREQGVFDGRKIRELYGKLDEVEDKIRELNNEQVFIVNSQEEASDTEETADNQKDALLIKKEKIKREIEQQGIFDGKRRKDLFSQLDDIEDRIRDLNESILGPVQGKQPSGEPKDDEKTQEEASAPQEDEVTEKDKQELIAELRKKKDAIKDEIEQQGIFAGKRIKQLYGELDVVEDEIKHLHIEMNPYMETEEKEEKGILERPLEELTKDELRQRKEKVKQQLEELGGVFDGKSRKELFAQLDAIEERQKELL